jgi:hypothetical protein
LKLTKQNSIASARAFAGDRVEVLINILQLNPIDEWTKWTDAEGNTLKLCKNKGVLITPTKYPIQKTSDIFMLANPEFIEEHSYWKFVINGNDKKVVSFLGNDGVLRSCFYDCEVWKNNFSPLLLGIDNLWKVVDKYLDSDYKKIKGVKLPFHKDFVVENAFVCGI